MARRTKSEKTELHIHNWEKSFTESEMKCACGDILVSQAEWNRRDKEWVAYYEKVWESRAYKRFQEQKEAFKNGHMEIVKLLALEAREDLKNKKDWIEKPHFPDPSSWNHYVISNAEDDVVFIAQKIFNE